ncbi:glyoxalase/bleomycin resistance/extradiol dioxygenase family protein [Actinomadura logoneensis]|uniref:Glyoxalase/bleomycin resistance/extradiol dioxygenase family protein n=1 Tax=Actinomadura logoneensis TaxID=2293572 RepID=A0A372JB14_9ACTN|nr:VOC family protein [Actinomadura logoneensis]RFU37016.1 glyoxalase/bleomycin resistance/extradiol dioxygenase family protein [Actinomadura logoneensis]
MDALYPRLLVDDFDACARFYTAALRELLGVEPAKVLPAARYAHWDLDGEGALSLFGRAAIAAVTGTAGLPAAPSTATASVPDRSMLVFEVDDVDAAAKALAGFGASVAAAPADRPEWGPNLRTAHLRDPDGNLLELQSH